MRTADSRTTRRYRVRSKSSPHCDLHSTLPLCLTVETEKDVVDDVEKEHGQSAQMQIGFIAERIRPTHIAELEGVDEMEACVQRGNELNSGREMPIELLDEEHHVDGDVGVERGRELGEFVVHLHGKETQSERSCLP